MWGKRQPVGTCCMTQGTQTEAVDTYRGGDGVGGGGTFKMEGTYILMADAC